MFFGTYLRRMPELSEVEAARELIERHCVGKKIVHVNVLEGGSGKRAGQFDEIVIAGVTADEFVTTLTGRTMNRVCRKGKHMWAELDAKPHVAFHFGMTGFFAVRGQDSVKYIRLDSNPKDTWPPNFTKCELRLEDGTQVAFSDARRLARIRLTNDPTGEPPISELGYDPMHDAIPEEEFFSRLVQRDVPIKVALLDQSFTAGVGNWIADEVLYQAQVHPCTRTSALSRERALAVLHALKDVVICAVSCGADPERFPRDWLFHYRWSKGSTAPKDAHGRPILFVTVGGRTSAYVPHVQGRGPGSNGGAPMVRSTTAPSRARVRADHANMDALVVVKDEELATSLKPGRMQRTRTTPEKHGGQQEEMGEGREVQHSSSHATPRHKAKAAQLVSEPRASLVESQLQGGALSPGPLKPSRSPKRKPTAPQADAPSASSSISEVTVSGRHSKAGPPSISQASLKGDIVDASTTQIQQDISGARPGRTLKRHRSGHQEEAVQASASDSGSVALAPAPSRRTRSRKSSPGVKTEKGSVMKR